MDLVSVARDQIFGMLWYLIPATIILGLVKSSWFKGLMGESIVNISAKFLLDNDTYHIIKNVTLPIENGTTQIDHIIVSIYGIFVVETKNMKGWVFGNSHQKIWTQKIYKNTYKFQNPLHQNYKHVKTLESKLNISEKYIHSVIVFIGDSTFKTEMPENVTYGGGYARYIKSKKQQVLSESETIEIINRINRERLKPSIRTNQDHVRHVRQIVGEKENEIQQICPKCGSNMVLRKPRKDSHSGRKFWGCTNFPKCRGIVNIEN
jgi:restriction system protein